MKDALHDLEQDWNNETIINYVKAVFETLKKNDKIDSYVLIKKVVVEFKGVKFADCAPWGGKLIFGDRLFKNSFKPNSFGYKLELPYINKCCNTKEERLAWLVVHEYCHLIKEQRRHNKGFFELVSKKYLKFLAPHFSTSKRSVIFTL